MADGELQMFALPRDFVIIENQQQRNRRLIRQLTISYPVVAALVAAGHMTHDVFPEVRECR